MTHKNIYTKSLTQIKESNQQLRQIAKDSYVLEFSRKKRRAKRNNIDFITIRNHARSLYNVVVTGKSWKCQFWGHHMASLRLEAIPVCHFFPFRAKYIKLWRSLEWNSFLIASFWHLNFQVARGNQEKRSGNIVKSKVPSPTIKQRSRRQSDHHMEMATTRSRIKRGAWWYVSGSNWHRVPGC